jgi:hypothetical protein
MAVSLLVAESILTQVSRVAFGLRTHVPLIRLVACLGLSALAHCHSKPSDENQVGGEAVLAVEGSMTVFC